MKNFIKWCVCVCAIAFGGLDVAGQHTWLPQDRIMLFNDYPADWFDASGLNPMQGYSNTNWWHDSVAAPGDQWFNQGPLPLLNGVNHTFKSITDGGRVATWTFTNCRVGTPAFMNGARAIPPSGYNETTIKTNLMAILRNIEGSMIETPFYPDGVGTLYFDAINVFQGAATNLLVVEIATNMVDYSDADGVVSTNSYWDSVGQTNVTEIITNFVYGTIDTLYEQEFGQYSNRWEKVSEFVLNQTNGTPYRYQFTFNYRHAARIRIWKRLVHGTDADNLFTAVDNIRVSRPPSDVMLSRPEVICSPGYPSINTNFTIQCRADNFGTNDYERTFAGGGNTNGRTLQVWYRWRYLDQMSNEWAFVNMTHKAGTGDRFGNGEIWQGNIPAQPIVGDLEYYFTVDFKGYRYQTRDYTKVSPGVPGEMYWPGPEYSETVSPRTFRNDTSRPEERDFYVRLTPYPSSFESVSVVTGPPYMDDNPIPMAMISNGVWRGMVPVNNGGVTNLKFYFKGDKKYSEANGVGTISRDAVYWSEPAQASVGVVPFGGVLDVTGTPRDNPIQIIADGGGYVQVLFDMNEMTYMASRAEYQNFNAWTAPSDHFSDTSGQATKQRFDNTFNAWPVKEPMEDVDIFSEFLIGSPALTNEYAKDPFRTAGGWQAGNGAMYVSERVFANTDNRPAGAGEEYRNMSLKLQGGSSTLGLGYVHSTAESLPDGLATLSFKARLDQPVAPSEAMHYKLAFTNRNYAVRADVKADDLFSPATPSISVFGYYQSLTDFYEFRVAQTKDIQPTNPRRDQRVLCSLYKWHNGTPHLIASMVPDENLVLSGQRTIELRLHTINVTTTRIRCKFGAAELSALGIDDNGQQYPGESLSYGTFGFMSSGCRIGVSNVRTYATDSSGLLVETPVTTVLTPTLSSPTLVDAVKAQWAIPAGRWEIRNSVTPNGIYSMIPAQNIGIYLQQTEFGNEEDPASVGSPKWSLYKEIPITGFGYTEHSLEICKWRSHFLMLQVMGRTNDAYSVDVAVDEFSVDAWRGQTFSDLTGNESESNNEVRNSEWVATEARVESQRVSGLNEGRVSGNDNMTQRNPMTSVQMSTRYANMAEGWITNSTYVYNGWIYLDGTYRFAKNFKGKMRLVINDRELIDLDASTPTGESEDMTMSSTWCSFELRVGFGADGSGGPASPSLYNGLGLAYHKNSDIWRPLTDDGSGTFLQADDKRIILDHTQEGRGIFNDGSEGDWIAQAVRSPRLENNAGLMEFDYQVTIPPAKLTVQFAPSEDTSASAWRDVRSWVVSNRMDEFRHELAYLGTNVPGYLRVINDRDGERYTNAVVVINNATVWDEPFVDDTAWRSYNVKITKTDLQRVMLDESNACFLNNSQTAETDPVQTVYNESFVVSPLLPTGLGSLSFMARVYTNNQTASLFLYTTTSDAGPRAPTNEWTIAETFSITNNLYETYTFKPSDGRDYRAFKLVVPTMAGGGNRVCVEELAVAEPVLPGFEIAGVFPMCIDGNEYNTVRRQPLHNDQVGIQAQVSNIRLRPQNIRFFVDYYVGTDYWGVGNWPSNEVTTLSMDLYDPNSLTYRTTRFNDIPPQEKNSVVQYSVWAKYTDENGMELTTRQKEASFTNPDWYYPIDLNVTYASKGWSPYYIVYDVPVGAIWINEINVYESQSSAARHAGENQYVEIAVPAGFDMAGWKIDFVRGSPYQTSTVTLPADLPSLPEVTNGYAFLVLGEHDSFRDINMPKLDKLDLPMPDNTVYYGVVNLKSLLPGNWLPGGIRLRRPLGIYEHLVVYDCAPSGWGTPFSGALWAENDPEKKFEYVGLEDEQGSLGVITNTSLTRVPQTNDWAFAPAQLGWTPGRPNTGQSVPNAVLMAPGVSNVMVSASLVTARGTQNGSRSSLTFRLKQGESTNILYTADSWYRLKSIKVNGDEQLFSEATSYNLDLTNVQTNLTISASFGMRGDVDALGLDSDILAWLQGFGDGTFEPCWYYGPFSVLPMRELSLKEKYWLNIDPTVTNHLRGGIVNVEKEGPTTNFFLTVYLDLNGSNITNLMPESGVGRNNAAVFKIKGKQQETDPQWSFMSQHTIDESSFNSNHTSRVFIRNPFLYGLQWETFDATQPYLHFSWMIEYEDPRISAPLLRDEASP